MVAAVVLAAGAGSRFVDPAHKLTVEIDGVPLVQRSVGVAVAAGLATYVVTGAADLDALLDPLADRITVVANPSWADGQATSVRAGIAAAAADGHDAVVVGLGDQPALAVEAWRLVAAADSHPIVVATYDGRRGHPVRLAAEVWGLLPATGDAVARSLMADRPDLVREIACPGTPADIDTVDDLSAWG